MGFDPISLAVAGVEWLVANPAAAVALVQTGSSLLEGGAEREAANNAANAQQQGISQAQQYQRDAFNLGKNEYNQGYDRAESLIGKGYSDAENRITQGYDLATGQLNQGLTDYARALQPWQQQGKSALDQYMQTINGGNMAEDPAFKLQDQALRNKMASLGASQSPSAMANAYSPLYAEMYTRKLNALQPVLGYGFNASQGIGTMGYNRGTAAAGLAESSRGNLAELARNRGSVLGGMATQRAGTLADMYSQFGSNMSKLALGSAEVEGSRALSNTDYLGSSISKGLGTYMGMTNPDRYLRGNA